MLLLHANYVLSNNHLVILLRRRYNDNRLHAISHSLAKLCKTLSGFLRIEQQLLVEKGSYLATRRSSWKVSLLVDIFSIPLALDWFRIRCSWFMMIVVQRTQGFGQFRFFTRFCFYKPVNSCLWTVMQGFIWLEFCHFGTPYDVGLESTTKNALVLDEFFIEDVFVIRCSNNIENNNGKWSSIIRCFKFIILGSILLCFKSCFYFFSCFNLH